MLIKNLPTIIKGGNEKELSNIHVYETYKALEKCKYINFNSNERVSFLVFDIDSFKDVTALEYFKNIDKFLDYIMENIGLEPTYILETSKGFHFAYHLKNHVYIAQKKALEYATNIKKAITVKLKCDIKASHRLSGVWRNPLLHNYYYSHCINYELSDFKNILIENKNLINTNRTKRVKIDEINEGNRNNSLFEAGMRYAKNKNELTVNDILFYLLNINQQILKPLPSSELSTIADSIFKYWSNNSITYGSIIYDENINVGVMEFEKMKNLSYEDYLKETKRRQSLSAKRTNEIVKNRKELMLNAKQIYLQNQQEINLSKIKKATFKLEEEGKKITVASVSKVCGLDRRTVKRYLKVKSFLFF